MPVLLNPQTGQCKISGAALFDYDHHGETTVPLNPDQGIIGADSLDRSRLASPYVHYPLEENPRFEPGTILGYPVHVRCWDFMLVHELGTFVDNHLPAIVHALRQQYNDAGWRANILRHQPDPGVIRPIQSLVFKAQQRKRPRFQSKRYEHRDRFLLLRSLPVEILLMVFAQFESKDFAAMQEATGLYLGDDFWRSRIPPDVFFEAEFGKGDDIDWAFLCVKLERLDLENLEGMAGRRYILGRLDKAERLVKHIISDE